jgi:hypothetical protein
MHCGIWGSHSRGYEELYLLGYIAGHSSLNASLSRFNLVSTAEHEWGDGLQTEEHIFWACKLYED